MSSEKYSLSCLSGRYYTYLEALCSCHSCRGQTTKGKPEFSRPAGAAFSTPPHPHAELVTPTSFPDLGAFTEKAVCDEVGKCSFLPGPKCAPKADGLQGSPGGASLEGFGSRKKAEASERAWLGLPASQWSLSSKPLLIFVLGADRPRGWFPLHRSSSQL